MTKQQHNDVIRSAMASQITSLTIVYSTIYSRRRSKKTSKLRVTGLCEGNSPVTGEFPAQRAPITQKMFPFDDVIMKLVILSSFVHTSFCGGVMLCLVTDNWLNLKHHLTYTHMRTATISTVVCRTKLCLNKPIATEVVNGHVVTTVVLCYSLP